MSWRSTLLGVVTSAPLKPSASSSESAYISNQWDDPGVLYYYFYVELLLLGLACRFQGAMSCNDMHDNFQAQFRLVDPAMRLRD